MDLTLIGAGEFSRPEREGRSLRNQERLLPSRWSGAAVPWVCEEFYGKSSEAEMDGKGKVAIEHTNQSGARRRDRTIMAVVLMSMVSWRRYLPVTVHTVPTSCYCAYGTYGRANEALMLSVRVAPCLQRTYVCTLSPTATVVF